MLENIPPKDLGYELGRFNVDEFNQKIWDDQCFKKKYRNSSNTPSEVSYNNFITKNTKESYANKVWTDILGPDQIIPQEFWHPKSYFDSGVVPARLDHHFFITFYESINRMNLIDPYKRNDVLILLPCKQAKPYNKETTISSFAKLSKVCGFDLAVASASIVPITPYDGSTQYPFNIYNWPDNRVGEYDQLVNQWLCTQLSHLIMTRGYKRIIFWGINDHLETFFREAKAQLGGVVDIDLIGGFDGLLPQVITKLFSKGLGKLRFGALIASRFCVCLAFGLNPDAVLADASDYANSRDKFLNAFGEVLGREFELEEIPALIFKYQLQFDPGMLSDEKLPQFTLKRDDW